jgi:undecaprenyl-diphosphatase
MSLLHLLMLALVQGITEFLPISSSGHLILFPALLGIEDQGVMLDVAVHVGTLGAVVVYFRHEVARAVRGGLRLLTGDVKSDDARLALLLILATIPVVIAGAIFKLTGLVDQLRSVAVVGWATLIFGLVLYWADRSGSQSKEARDWNLKDALIMGLWQVIALVPGASRSGVTITGARFLGYNREDAARLAMLMSIPTIVASGVLLAGDVIAEANWPLARDASIAALMAFAAALAALALMMRLLRSVSFTPYVIYRIVLGVILLWIAYS